MIDSISFGKLLFQGKVSRSDTIVYKDRMNTKWWIEKRNLIEPGDLDEVLKENPEAVVVGRGFMNLIDISDQAVEALKAEGAEVIIEKSDEAAETFNRLAGVKRTVGLFHLI